MSPNSVFDAAFDKLRGNDTVTRVYGEPLKGYGRDHGGHREGRRNFIEHTVYDEESDGSKRIRVRFNIKGPYARPRRNLPSRRNSAIVVHRRNSAVVVHGISTSWPRRRREPPPRATATE